VASLAYEHERAREQRHPRADPAERDGPGEGSLWAALSLAPEAAGGDPRNAYFGAVPPAAFPGPVPGEGAPPAEEEPEEESAPPSAAPKSLRHDGRTDNADATWGYETFENYTVLDDKGAAIKGFDVNETFPTAPTNDVAKCDWRRGKPGGFTSATTTFADDMQGELSDKTPTPQSPKSPRGATKVQHWDQEWYIGSTKPGSGTKVQTNTFQKYQDHAAHENVKSPP
jgi:hypothetical protein